MCSGWEIAETPEERIRQLGAAGTGRTDGQVRDRYWNGNPARNQIKLPAGRRNLPGG